VRGREDRNVERRGDVDVEGRPEPLRLEELVAAARSDRDVLQHVEVPSRRNPTGKVVSTVVPCVAAMPK